MIENDIDGFKDKLDERSRRITDSTSLYWNVFAYLCEDGEYQKASDYFLENTGALIIYPPHSHLRSRLIIDIAKPLLLEYQPVDKARTVYMDLLQVEFYGQMLTWDTHGSEYCPASLPDVILEYGVCLAQTGKKEEAVEMKDIIYASAKDIWGDETVAQYLRYQLLIKVAIESGDTAEAKEMILAANDYLDSASKDGGDKEIIEAFKIQLNNGLKQLD